MVRGTGLSGEWDSALESWVNFVREGKDFYREEMNNPAFFNLLGNVRGKRILDLACGEGSNTRTLAKKGARVVGVDFSKRMIELARQEEKRDGLGIKYYVSARARRRVFMGASVVEAYGLKYLIDENARFIVEETYEPFMKDMVKLAPGNVFVDVGAHVGKYSFYASRQVGDAGRIVAVEPHPENFKNLKKGIEVNGLTNLVAIRKACSNYSGEGFLKESELSAKHELVQEVTRVKVVVDTLDNILLGLRVRRTDMVKIDVNGSEYKVLQGARRTLKVFRPSLIVEVTSGCKTRVFKYLKELGYERSILSETKRYWNLLFSPDRKGPWR
jgi:FkbM family methyltransferase